MEIGENRRDAHYVEFRAKQRSGKYVWMRCRGYLTRDECGIPVIFAGIMHKMDGQNKVDPLTQLFNHRMFMKRIRKYIEKSQEEKIAVAILDVDNFRQINELYSRKFGDRILCTIAYNIQVLLPDNARLFRLDNDRLGFLMRDAGKKEVNQFFSRIQKRFSALQEWKKEKLEIHLSAGCAFFSDSGQTADELYLHADYALQYAKEQGKDRMVIFTEEILNQKSHMLELLKVLRDAMNHEFRGFYLDYQPQVNGRTKALTGVEALVRFCDEKGNRISPVEFIPVMEKEGMIYEMGRWVLRQAIRDAGEWIRIKPDFDISVNASALEMMNDQYIEDVEKILEEEKFPAKNLVIELTESSAVQRMDIFRNKYKKLREMGIRIAMDDFGTGYSSLEFLKNAPIDLVKIDRSFLKDILYSRFDSAFITFIVEICHDVNIKVCQEGVETLEEYEILKKMELDCIQGYYFGKPMSKNAIRNKISAECQTEGND